MIRIASAQGFWGDWPQAPGLQVRSGPIDYLVFDYLAEVTMSILQKQKRRSPEKGYATDFCDVMEDLLPDLLERKVRVIANAGGVNPLACAREVLARAARVVPGREVRVGVVLGDDVLDRVDSLDLTPMEPGGPTLADIRHRMISANVYIGYECIVEALRQGCDIVVCGRVTDTAITLAPIVHHFSVPATDLDALATGIVAGHVLECGAQSSGGNFLARRLPVEDMVRIGFPIAEVRDPHHVVITKHDSLGGEVSMATVKEQLLYEIGDPATYITPDVTVDFSSIQVSEDGPGRVMLSGIKGRSAPEKLKVSATYQDGWIISGQLTYTWPDAEGKARAAGELVRRRCQEMGLNLTHFRVETIGASACHAGIDAPDARGGEVTLRVCARSASEEDLEALGREIVPLVLTGPPGATGFAGGRPKPREVLAYWPGLVPRAQVTPRVEILTSNGAR
jgi:hypothetical protein